MKKLLLFALLLLPSSAFAQCNGVFANNTACGNISGSSNLPRAIPLSSFPANAPGGSAGQVQTNSGSGTFSGITNTQLTALINAFTSALSGAVPASGGGTTKFLRADGTWVDNLVSANIIAATGISVSGTCNTSIALSCTISQAFSQVTVQASPSAPANTGSTTGVMSGFGSSCTLTPALSGRMDISIIFGASNNTNGNAGTFDLRYGTGAAPAANAAVTGTQAGTAQVIGLPTANVVVGMHLRALITGLTPGTAYWFDLNRFTNANTLAVSTPSCSGREY